MKTRSIIAALLLLVAGLQTSWAQERGMKVWRNGSFKGYVVSRIDSIQFVNLAAGVDLSQNELTMEIGDSVLLTATVFPDNASNEVRWSSSNPDVASVSSYGMVTAISSGYSTIICHVIDGVDVEAECLVKVGNTDGIPVTCAEALELATALEANATSVDFYSVTGYITEVVGNVSRNQQTFWMADTKDGGRVFEAYWANLPEGVAEFKAGMKVTIYGKLHNWVSTDGSKVTPEIINADVVILEDGGEQGGIQHVSIAEFLAKADANTTYELTGTVKNISNTTFGNFDLVEGDASIYIYGLLDLEGNKRNFASLGIAEGDKVTLTGKYTVYNEHPEIVDAQFVSVEKGGSDVDPVIEPVTDLVNGGFESWISDSIPTGWQSASTASSAVLRKSTDAHSGTYACLVTTGGTQNKRLANQEITLEAGTYTFSFYAKSTTADVCQTRAGYVPVIDGAVDFYKYGSYVNINNSEWTLVTYDFELTEKTTLCLLVMNPKNSSYSVSQDILVDDAALVKK